MVHEIHLRGLLIPVDWHANGRVKTVALATSDEQEIAIGGPLLGHILCHLRQRVDVWGMYDDPVLRNSFCISRIQPLTAAGRQRRL